MSKFLSNLLIFCSGANRYYLDQCPNERHKFLPIGFSILITTCLASIAMLFAAYSIFGDSVADVVLIAFSLFWGMAIFSIDWGLVKTMRKPKTERSFLREFFTIPVLFRLAVAVLISYSISRPLEVAIYQKRLKAQIETDRQAYIDQERDKITNRNNATLVGPLDSVTANLKDISNRIAQGPQTESYKQKLSALKECREEYATLKANNQKQIADIYIDIKAIRNDAANYDSEFNRLTRKAESRIAAKRNTIARLRGAIDSKANACQAIQSSMSKEEEAFRGVFKGAEKMNTDRGAVLAKELDIKTLDDSAAMKKILNMALISFDPNSPGLITSLESMANFEQTPAGKHVWIVRLVLLLIFICIDTAPIVVKLLTKRGPYEAIQDAEEERMQYLAMAEKNANILLISNMATAQNRVLRRAIDEYEEEEMENLNKRREHYRTHLQNDQSK